MRDKMGRPALEEIPDRGLPKSVLTYGSSKNSERTGRLKINGGDYCEKRAAAVDEITARVRERMKWRLRP